MGAELDDCRARLAEATWQLGVARDKLGALSVALFRGQRVNLGGGGGADGGGGTEPGNSARARRARIAEATSTASPRGSGSPRVFGKSSRLSELERSEVLQQVDECCDFLQACPPPPLPPTPLALPSLSTVPGYGTERYGTVPAPHHPFLAFYPFLTFARAGLSVPGGGGGGRLEHRLGF